MIDRIRLVVDKETIKAVQKGDPKAFRELYEEYAPLLMGMALRYATDRADAEDILQESFVRIHQKASSFRGEGSFEGWMKRILVSTALNFINKRKKEEERRDDEEEVEGLDMPDEGLSDELDEKALIRALNELPEGYRAVFNLVVMEGYEHQEVAEMLGINVGTSQSQLYKAKRMLRKHLAVKELNESR